MDNKVPGDLFHFQTEITPWWSIESILNLYMHFMQNRLKKKLARYFYSFGFYKGLNVYTPRKGDKVPGDLQAIISKFNCIYLLLVVTLVKFITSVVIFRKFGTS